MIQIMSEFIIDLRSIFFGSKGLNNALDELSTFMELSTIKKVKLLTKSLWFYYLGL